MSHAIDIKVPDIGDFKDVPVIEVFVKPGDTVKAEDPLVSLESDKATMDVPAPRGGVGQGDRRQGRRQGQRRQRDRAVRRARGARRRPSRAKPRSSARRRRRSARPRGVAEVRVPDIGDFKDVPVIEIFVKPGDTVKAEDPLVSLESDKATMDVPAPLGGHGAARSASRSATRSARARHPGAVRPASAPAAAPAAAAPAAAAAAPAAAAPAAAGRRHRRDRLRARLRRPGGAQARARTGRRSRPGQGHRATRAASCAKTSRPSPRAARQPAPSREAAAASGGGVGGIDLLPWPKVDFAKFGPVERKALSRIKKISGGQPAPQLGRSSRTSRPTTKPTSPISKPSACR